MGSFSLLYIVVSTGLFVVVVTVLPCSCVGMMVEGVGFVVELVRFRRRLCCISDESKWSSSKLTEKQAAMDWRTMAIRVEERHWSRRMT